MEVSDNLLKRYNDAGQPLYIPLLGHSVFVEIQDRDVTGASMMLPTRKIYPPLNLDLDLPEGIVAITSDKKSIYGTFKSSYAAAKFFNLKDPRTITRRLGQDFLINTSLGNFFFTASENT